MSTLDAELANTIVKALQKAGLKVNGVKILDVDDPATWFFSPELSESEELRADAIIANVLKPIVISPPAASASLRALWLLFTDEEYFALAISQDPAVVYGHALLAAAPEFSPIELWVSRFFSACVVAKVLSQQRADEVYLAVNPPV